MRAADVEREVVRRWPQAVVDSARARRADSAYPVEVYLVDAAVAGEAWALNALEREVFSLVRDRLAQRYDRARADEAIQQVREQVLVQGAVYSGRGPVIAWVTVIAARRLLALSEPDHEQLEDVFPIRDTDEVEVALLKARFGPAFKRALATALASLHARQRLLLRLHFCDGLSAEKIGAVFHVHRATASQWLSAAKTELRERARALVQEQTGVSPSELESIAEAVQQMTDLSLPRLLAEKPTR